MGKGTVPSFYCLASIYLLISVFLHPMKTYPLPYPSWHCPSADDGSISELNIPSPSPHPALLRAPALLSRGPEMAE